MIRQDESGDFKWSLTNLPDPKDWQRDLYRQNQRFWIEHAFHEAKSQTGMAQYQVRVWRVWHHHMALVCLATLFMNETKARHRESAPLLSYRDITELLDDYLRAGTGTRPKCMTKFENAMPPANEISIEGGTSLPESRLMLI